MSFHLHEKIRYFQFEQLGSGVTHAIFTRRGGVSPAPWAALNLGSTVGDDLERVHENRRLALSCLVRDPASVYDVWQVHGVEVAIAEAPRAPETRHLQADTILTDKPGLTILMRFADCVPIMLHDPIRKVVGIAHAGWIGTVRGVARSAVEAMQKHYGSNPADIRVAIGPCICPDHYEVGQEVVNQVQKAFGRDASSLLLVNSETSKFDLRAANRLLLEQAGVQRIEMSGLCTACAPEDWYSHRAEKGHTGRFGAMIALV
jgi:YfiH family protein